MNPSATYQALQALSSQLQAVGGVLQSLVAAVAVGALVVAMLPAARAYLGWAIGVLAGVLVAGEGVLVWFHWRLYQVMAVADPSTGLPTGHVAAALWIESEKLYVWALLTAVMGLLIRRQRDELLRGVLISAALLAIGGTVVSQPFTNPLPSLIGQYTGYVQAMSIGGQAAGQAFYGMESARQFYYNAWFMWVHPPLLFFSYGAFVVSFVATVQMIRQRHSSFETTAYRWARLGYVALTLGMLLGFPWAIMSWQGEAWWWSGKVNMSIMMWLLYTAYLHARLYLRTNGMWKAVAALAVLSFVILLLTYAATYVVPGAHSYAAAETSRTLASTAGIAPEAVLATTRRGGLA